MQSKNKARQTDLERAWVRMVKLQPCALCGSGGGEAAPSEAHEIRQGLWFTALALCAECHRGSNGWHGNKSLWRIRKADELSILNETIEAVVRSLRLG